MSEVIEVLYSSNLGCDAPDNIYDVAAHLLRFEQKFFTWQRYLPAGVSLIEMENLKLGDEPRETVRLRVILTLRFLNLRILTHRTLLSKYLEAIYSAKSASQQLSALKQVGSNSLRTCAQSALHIIELMREALKPTEPPRQLLGASWFSLYYGSYIPIH